MRIERTRRSRSMALRPDAMRYYQTSAVSLTTHHAWLDGIVLISTIMFGLLLGYFLIDILPQSGASTALRSSATTSRSSRFSFANPLAIFFPSPEVHPAVSMGQAQQVQGVVAQAVDARRAKGEGGREATGGNEFFSTTVVIDNQTKQTFSYNLSDFQVKDSKGRSHNAETIRGAGWLASGTIEPGQHVLGTVTFLIPEGDAHPEVSFTSNPLRAVLRWDA